jgi:hypothetical protein
MHKVAQKVEKNLLTFRISQRIITVMRIHPLFQKQGEKRRDDDGSVFMKFSSRRKLAGTNVPF